MTKTVLFRKFLFALCAMLLATLCMTALSTPNKAGADESTDQDALYEPVIVPIKDDTTIEDPWENVTYEKTYGNYQVLLCGVSEANQEVLADAILANLQGDEPVKFTNKSFVDAEKYSVAFEDFDKYHCWLASTSNILTLTGWTTNYFNPLEGGNFTDEDDVLAFMSSSFQDQSCDPCLAYAYFFDGLFGGTHHDWIRLSKPTANKPFIGTTHTGFDPQVGYANIAKRVNCGSNLANLSVLEDLQDHALELSIGGATSHSVTITGVVIDTSKTGAERYVAILIADSDNDASEATEAPATYDDANIVKSAATNSYTMYHVSLGEVSGQTVALVNKYMKNRNDAYISSFTQVEYFDYYTRNTALETADNATCDAKTTGDIALFSIEVFDKDFNTKSAYATTDQLQLMAVIMNMNVDVAFNTETTKAQTLQNRSEAYRDGVLVGTITDGANVSLAEGINGTMGTRLFVDLSNYDFLKTPGTYTLNFYLNTNNLAEAYVSNNDSPQSCTFTIAEDPSVGTDTSADDDTDDNASETANDTGDDNSSSSSESNALAKTGDSVGFMVSGAALIMVLAGLVALVSARKR